MRYPDAQGRSRPWGGHSSRPSQGPIQAPPAPPLGSLLEKLTPEGFEQDKKGFKPMAEITHVKLLASFNWADPSAADTNGPSIIVPGMPPLWDPPAEATRLPEDSGRYFRDQNAARHPKHPIEPAVKATLSQNPDLDTGIIDIFGCTSTLGHILRFLKKHDKPFRFTVEAVGRTVFFVRREDAPDEAIAGPRGFGPTGHGHPFPERYTRWPDDAKDSSSHQRIISYDFAGLKCVVRSETDGYFGEELGEEEEDAFVASKEIGEGLAIENVNIRAGGRLIPQHAIFELKTRGIHKKDDDHLADNLPRMWTAQIPFFVLGLHEYGLFRPEEIIIKDVRGDITSWQHDNQELLLQYSSLLQRLVALARDPAFGKYEVCLQKPGVLETRKQGGTVLPPLSSPLIWVWADWKDSESDSNSEEEASAGADEGQSDAAAYSDDDERPLDFTACTDGCEYCGRCRYKLH